MAERELERAWTAIAALQEPDEVLRDGTAVVEAARRERSAVLQTAS